MELEVKQETKGRKLKFRELGAIIKIVKSMDIKYCREKARDTLAEMSEKESKIKLEIEKTKDNKDEIAKAKKLKELDTELQQELKNTKIDVFIEILVHIIDNFEYAENEIFKFFSMYKNIDIEETQEKDIDWVIDTAIELYKFGLPSAITDILSADDIKKKMTEYKDK
jgi:hypothetical protein